MDPVMKGLLTFFLFFTVFLNLMGKLVDHLNENSWKYELYKKQQDRLRGEKPKEASG